MKFIALSLVLIASQSLFASQDIQSLNKKLDQQKAGWVAKKTWISTLSKTEVKRMMGLRGQNADVEFKIPAGLSIKSDLPTSLDWRNKDGKNWVSPILNQANCGSCVAFATVGVLETQYRISSGLPGFNLKLSPQHLFACGGGGCDFGWMPDNAAQYLQSSGVPDEACLPYSSGATGQDVACTATCADAPRRSYKISSYSSPTRNAKDVNAVKLALQKGPVVTTLTVAADFLTYADGVYKHVTGDALGGHAISIVGYDDNLQAFIIRNSWGEDWGQKGFGYVSYDDDSGVGDQTWLYETPSMAGAISVNSPSDYSYYAGTLKLDTQSTFSATDSLTATVFDQNAHSVLNVTCTGQTCQNAMDISKLADGKYEIEVMAMDKVGGTVSTSTRHLFYVANQKPTLALSFSGHDTNLDTPLKARIQMDVTADSSTVPMSGLEFHFRGPDGIEHKRSSQIVMKQMVVGWRTNVVPNGTYDIWFVGHVLTNMGDTQVESAHKSVTLAN